MGRKMGGSFGEGAYGVYVTWKAKGDDGHHQETLYRYKTEEERANKLKDFKKNSKVKNAKAVAGYSSW